MPKEEKKYQCDRERTWRREAAKKLRIIRDMGGVCTCCGLDGMKKPWIIDIHHTDPSKKEIPPNKMYDYPYKVIQKELETCVLLCANCHRDFHNKKYEERYARYKDVLEELVNNAHIDFWDERDKQNEIIDEKVRNLISEGKSMGEISNILNVTKGAVHKYCKRAGVKPNYSPMRPGKVTEEIFYKIKELKARGLKSREIGKELGLSKNTILNHWEADTF